MPYWGAQGIEGVEGAVVEVGVWSGLAVIVVGLAGIELVAVAAAASGVFRGGGWGG